MISHYVYLMLRFLNNPLKAYKQAETMSAGTMLCDDSRCRGPQYNICQSSKHEEELKAISFQRPNEYKNEHKPLHHGRFLSGLVRPVTNCCKQSIRGVAQCAISVLDVGQAWLQGRQRSKDRACCRPRQQARLATTCLRVPQLVTPSPQRR